MEQHSPEVKGSLTVICGCMFSGKTEELIRQVKREIIARRRVQILKSHRDTRYALDSVSSHTGLEMTATRLIKSTANTLREIIDKHADVIAIDEVQFFDYETADLCDELADSGYKVIVAGLDLDFRGEPFRGPMATLMSKADKLVKLDAICMVCGERATRTQRFVGNRPARWDEDIILVGDENHYQAVCRSHHQIEKPPTEIRDRTYKVIE